jgi:uncharacterized membrane protein
MRAMNSAERFEIDRIREGQNRVHRMVEELDRRIDWLTRELDRESTPEMPAAVAEIHASLPAKPGRVQIASPPPLPTAPSPVSASGSEAPAPVKLPLILPISSAPLTESSPLESEPLELKVGTYWMARIGIVILLTGLVFLGNYAYHRIIPLLGAWGKLSVLALAGGLLTGAGLRLEGAREALRNYGRVLLAGGAAVLYYTTYAAHFVQPLKVIESPLVGGMALLMVGGGILWFAHRRRSETVAMLAILLSYYTSAINAIGGFTLFSNLLLTTAAIFFLLRHQWMKISFASILATYGSYAFWRIHEWEVTGLWGSFGEGPAFLASYWVVFAVAAILTAPAVFRPAARTAFLTFNNGAFFAFAAHHFATHRPDFFWIFSVGFGAVLFVLSWISEVRRSHAPAVGSAYLGQGLLAITIGFIAKFTGPELALVLAVESAVLLVGMRLRHGVLYTVAAILCGIGAFALAMLRIEFQDERSLALGAALSAVLLFNSWWTKYLLGEWRERSFTGTGFVFGSLGLILAGATLWRETPAAWQPAAFAILAVAGLATSRLRLFEIALPAQVYAFPAALVFCMSSLEAAPEPWWSPVAVLLAPLVVMHWWQRVSVEPFRSLSYAVQIIFGSVTVAVALTWTYSFHQGEVWLAASAIIGLLTLCYGWITRAWTLALVGQFATLLSLCAFGEALLNGHPHWSAALIPVAALLSTGWIVPRMGVSRWASISESVNFAAIGRGYLYAGSVAFACWSLEYVPESFRVAHFAVLGAAQLLGATYGRDRGRAMTGAAYAGYAMLLLWAGTGLPVHWWDLLAIVAIPIAMRWSRRLTGAHIAPLEVRNVLVAGAVMSVWVWVTRWTAQQGHTVQITAVWASLALVVFGFGLALRERLYRFGGFAILGVSMLRLFVVDVWRFDTLYRIVSFLVLGAVLLILSFVYSRFAEAFRRWL